MGWRRIVTMDDADGRGRIVDDGEPPVLGGADTPNGVAISVMWVTGGQPVEIAQAEDRRDPAWSLGPLPPGGARWSLITFPPGAHARGMHRTETVDFVQVVQGEIDLVLSGGEERHLCAGDSVVQRGAEHAWENRGTDPCVLSTVMFDAQR